MPNIGDEIQASMIDKGGNGKFLWVGCPICKQERWAAKRLTDNRFRLCHSCNTLAAKKVFKL